MKFAIIALVAFAAVTQGYVLPQHGFEFGGNAMDKLIRSALEYVRTLLKQNQPYDLPDVPPQHIQDDEVNIDVTLTNVKISKADDFVVEKIQNNLPNLWAKFDLKAPQPHMEGDYTVSGTAYDKKISGSGTFKVDLQGMDQSGFIQMGVQDHGLIIKKITLDYDLEGADFTFTGLEVEGMTPEQVNEFLNKQLLATLKANKDETCKRVAAQVMEKGNELIKGKSLQEVIAWLKQFIHQ